MKLKSILIPIMLFLCFLPFVSPAIALAVGIIFSLLNWKIENASKYTKYALQLSIVLMGFGMNLNQVIEASKFGFLGTTISVLVVMIVGFLLGKLLKVDSQISLLISSGTAICGGSAIAAVSSVTGAKNYQISFALAVVFILNAIALFIFPILGHYLNLSQETFGYWAAIAIHDTSSVVGAGAIFGEKALEVATTVKLIRALWIIPLTLIISFMYKGKGKIKFPYFILFFVMAIIFAHLFPSMNETYKHFQWLGKHGMVIALFLIGSNISIAEAKQAGFRSFVLGILLWLVIGLSSLFVLMK